MHAVPGPAPSEEYPPGKRFSDCDACPEMVVVPSGSFMMGSPEGEAGRD
ncbi:MAG: formylglycine-generating enzyme family protein, partial [Pseudomonadota bacterium]